MPHKIKKRAVSQSGPETRELGVRADGISMSEMRLDNEAPRGLSPREFERLSELISAQCGIRMPPAKKIMLEARLQKRLRALRISSFREYCGLLFNSPDGADELPHMIDAVTTNKTEFFREPSHFTFLTETILPPFLKDRGLCAGTKFSVWSAGCSTGEEPYTLAILLTEFAARCPGFQFAIMATDISMKVLEKAQRGIYDQDQVTMIPDALLRKHFLRSRDREKGLVRVAPEVRALVQFQRLNLMDERFKLPQDGMDAIFCRNVMIYFDREKQYALLSRLCRHLKTGGHLFLGHSETVHGLDIPLVRVASAIYRKAP